jgi:hypothetical protein
MPQVVDAQTFEFGLDRDEYLDRLAARRSPVIWD